MTTQAQRSTHPHGEALWDLRHERLGALGIPATRRELLAPFTTYRVGGPAALFVDAESETVILDVLSECRAHPELWECEKLVLGRGSNLLVADRGVEAFVIRIGEHCATIERTNAGLRVGGAALLPVVARRSVAMGLTGFEWAVGVPGSIGGAVRMNAGGHGSEMSNSLRTVRVVDFSTGQDVEMDAEDLNLAYRRSGLPEGAVVVWADLELADADSPVGQTLINEIVTWRRENQPGGSNAGSVFANPAGASAGQLIERVGLKGSRQGGASISTKHANFIQAEVGTEARSILELMARARNLVAEETGVLLSLENRLWGFTSAERASVGLV